MDVYARALAADHMLALIRAVQPLQPAFYALNRPFSHVDTAQAAIEFIVLNDFTDDTTQYQALMNQGATYAKAHQLRPGIALSEAQMAQLTADIVWLVEKTITLPNGQTVKALVVVSPPRQPAYPLALHADTA